MIRRALLTLLVTAVAFAVAAAVIPGFEVPGGVLQLLWVALLFGLVNSLLGPILRLLSLPLTALTLGLFALVVDGALLAVTAWLSDSLEVGGFLGTVAAALVIAIVMAVLQFLLRPVSRARR